MNEWMNDWMNQRVNEWTNYQMNELTCEWILFFSASLVFWNSVLQVARPCLLHYCPYPVPCPALHVDKLLFKYYLNLLSLSVHAKPMLVQPWWWYVNYVGQGVSLLQLIYFSCDNRQIDTEFKTISLLWNMTCNILTFVRENRYLLASKRTIWTGLPSLHPIYSNVSIL